MFSSTTKKMLHVIIHEIWFEFTSPKLLVMITSNVKRDEWTTECRSFLVVEQMVWFTQPKKNKKYYLHP